MIEQLKVAAFMAEADQDLASAIRILKECDINFGVYSSQYNIHSYKQIMDSLGVGTIAIEIDDFNYDYHKDLAKHLNPKIAIYNWDGSPFEENFLSDYVNCSLEGNFIPTICPKGIKNDLRPRDKKLDNILEFSKRLHLCIDPVEILLRYNIDVYQEYIKKFMPRISAVIVRDYKVGVGNRPVGFGSVRWDMFSKDFDKYNGWLIMKPNLGTSYNNLNGRSQIFKSAYSCFVELVETCQ